VSLAGDAATVTEPASFLETLARWGRQVWNGLEPAADEWETGWREAIHSACDALSSSHGAIDAIDLRGERWVRLNPGRLLRLGDLARRVSAEYGVAAQVTFVSEAPVVRLVRARPVA
jgi:hypothetical protein